MGHWPDLAGPNVFGGKESTQLNNPACGKTTAQL